MINEGGNLYFILIYVAVKNTDLFLLMGITFEK